MVGSIPVDPGSFEGFLQPNTVAVSITAAAPIIKKAVFCVDNIEVSATVGVIQEYVEKLGVKVLTVHKCNLLMTYRQRREEVDPDDLDRKAFRVCVDKRTPTR